MFLMLSQNLKLLTLTRMFSDVQNRLHFSFDLVQSQGDPNTQNCKQRYYLRRMESLTRYYNRYCYDQVKCVLYDIGSTSINTASVFFGPEK